MANVLGELFGDIATAIRSKTGEEGTMKPAEFPEKIDGIMVDLAQSGETVVYKWHKVTGFALDSTFGAFSPGYVSPSEFTLEGGKSYRVIWDGAEWNCEAFAFEMSGMSIVAIGNASSLGLPGNGEPFLITYNVTANNTQFHSTEQKAEHTIGIYTMVDSQPGGGSGGSFPPGIYLEADSANLPCNWGQCHFTINGVRYALTLTSTTSTGTTYNIYKQENGAWTKKVSAYSMGYSSMVNKRHFVYNGKLHMMTNSCHITYDGETTVTKLTKPPQYLETGASYSPMFTQDGLLKYYSYSDGGVYVWNEATDTWTKESNPGAAYNYWDFYNVGNDVYAFCSYVKKACKYENKAFTDLFPIANYGNAGFALDGFVYSLGSSDYKLRKWNLMTGEETVVGQMAKYSKYNQNIPGIYLLNDVIWVIGATYDSSMIMNHIMHIIE